MARIRDAAAGDTLTRKRPITSPDHAALLVVDVQYYVAAPGYGVHKQVDPRRVPPSLQYYFQRVSDVMVPNIQRLQASCRRAGIEVLFTCVENLTLDGRDRSLDYKISGLDVPKGSREAQVLDPIRPVGDEIVLPKTSSSVFNSTNIDYVLRNLEVDYLIVVGMLTDQCVESAVRDACDLGYLVTVAEDACATMTQARHEQSLELYKGYCRMVSTDELLREIDAIVTSPSHA